MLTPRLLNAQTEREALIEHLLRLEPEDRHARFGTYVDTAAITAYVDRILERNDPVLIVEDRRAPWGIVAALHIAPLGDGSAELGLSVDPAWRRRGLGRTLLRAGGVLAYCVGLRRVRLEIAPDNRPMRILAEQCRYQMNRSTDGELSGQRELHFDETLTQAWLWWLATLDQFSRRPCALLRRASRRAAGSRRRRGGERVTVAKLNAAA